MRPEIRGISVIGIGRLGLCSALTYEKAGYDVIGVDNDEAYLEALRNKSFSTQEPGVVDRLREATRFSVTSRLDYAIESSDMSFILVPTPSLETGGYDHSKIDGVVLKIQALGKQPIRKHLVICSTVMPGFTDQVAHALADLNWSVGYNPEFVAQGSILRNLQAPDMVLIGERDRLTGDILESIYRRSSLGSPPVCRMGLLSAELAKISLNCFLTTKIAFANFIGDLAMKAGAEPEKILNAIGSDSRVGAEFLAYGYGYGGPCLPRDNRALSLFARTQGFEAPLSDSTDALNRLHLDYMVESFCSAHPNGGSIRLGPVSYKSGSPSIEESQQLAFAVALSKRGYHVILEDTSAVLDSVRRTFGNEFFDYQDTCEH